LLGKGVGGGGQSVCVAGGCFVVFLLLNVDTLNDKKINIENADKFL